MLNEIILNSLRNAVNRAEKIDAITRLIEFGTMTSTIIQEKEYLDCILILLSDEDDFVRIKATEAAEYFRDEVVVDVLIQILEKDKNPYVRGFAAKAIGSIGNIKARENLENALQDPDGFVVGFVSQSLKNINIKYAFSNKLEMLKAKMKESAKK